MNNTKEEVLNTLMYNVRDIQKILGCTRKQSRKVIRQVNAILSDRGKITAFGEIPIQCFEEFIKGDLYANLQGKRNKKI